MCVFAVGADGTVGGADELNLFLARHRVLGVEKALVPSPNGGAYWSFVVTYLDGLAEERERHGQEHNAEKIDYKQELTPASFALFVKLRDLRKRCAHDEGVPMYLVFTNAQLAAMAKARCASKAALRQIDGVGEARIDKYGERFLTEIAAHATDGKPALANCGTGEPTVSVLEGGSP